MAKTAHKAYAFTGLKIGVSVLEKGDGVSYDVDIRGHTNRRCACDDLAAVQACIDEAVAEWEAVNETRAAARTGAELEVMPIG